MTFRFVPIFTFYSSMKVLFKEKQTLICIIVFVWCLLKKLEWRKLELKWNFQLSSSFFSKNLEMDCN